jgi:trigger factor
MHVTVEKLSPVLVELEVRVPADAVRTEVEKEFARVQKNAKIRGFRPGKAPRHVLAHLYGDAIHADVARRLADQTLNRAMTDKQVQPLSQPAIVIGDVKADDGFSYKARFEVRPEIEAVKWEGLPAKRAKIDVTDAMVDEEIARLRREHSTLEAPEGERPAQAGDVLTIAFHISIDGAAPQGEKQEIDAELGGGQLLKELDDGLRGTKVDEHKKIAVTFPDRHPNPELRGKAAEFDVTVKDIKERKLPEVDDELAKDCGHESLAAMRDALRAGLEKDQKQKADDQVAEQLVLELCKANPIPVPPSLVEQQAQMTENELKAAARRQGQRGELPAELRQRARADAEIKVRAGLLMAEIAREKAVTINDADIEKAYVELAEQTGKNVAKVKADYREPKKREILLGMIMEDKILTLIEGAAQISEQA